MLYQNICGFLWQFQLFLVPLYRQTCLNQQNQLPMTNHPCSMGRTELATRYFPHIQPQTAWQKLRGLLAEDPDLAPLAQLKRRTFLPAEVNIIYQHLGQP